MTVLKFSAVMICLGAVTQANSSIDYIFANSYEVECDGGGCTYCNPAGSNASVRFGAPIAPHTLIQRLSAATRQVRQPPAEPVLSSPTARVLSRASPRGSLATCQNWCQRCRAVFAPSVKLANLLLQPVFTGSTEWGICI